MTSAPFLYPDIVASQGLFAELRRDLHAHPETAFQEFRTSDVIVSKLHHMGVDAVHRGLGGTGVVATIHGRDVTDAIAEKSVALRADMDALNMTEENDLPYKSTVPGKMHACGHDGHVAMLLAAGQYLAKTRHFDGTVYLIFQPAEEGGGGADKMIKDGLFEKFPVKSVWGMHNWPSAKLGTIALRPGPMMAASDEVRISIRGKGSHAARPHLGNDPVVVAAHIIVAMQSIVSRNINPFDQAVVSLCVLRAGSAHNVIPESAEIGGTIRSFAPAVRDMLKQRVRDICAGLALAHGVTIDVAFGDGYPATVNSPDETRIATDVAVALLGAGHVDGNMEPSMGAEDFSFMLLRRPGCYIRLGTGVTDRDPGLHHVKFNFNDDAIPYGASYWARLVETLLPVK